MRKKSVISILLAVSMTFTAGCGNLFASGTVDETMEREAVELIKSTVAMPDVVVEAATYRDIYVTDIYNGSVYPTVKEYAFVSPQTLKTFNKNLGDEVVPGDVLVYADDEKLLEQIESYQERVDNLKEEYQEFVEDTNETIEEAKDWMEYYADILEGMEENKPTDTTAADYAKRLAAWETENTKWQANYNIQDFNMMVAEEEMRQRTELYQLDYAHYNGKLQELLAQHKETKIVADVAGTVVSVGGIGYKAKDVPVIAVSCEGEKYIKAGYIYRVDVVYNSVDIYAFANGKRYEVTYVDDGIENISTFIVQDEKNELEAGTFANIVLVKKTSRDNVLTVASSAIYGTQTERYVYKMVNNKAVKAVVKCGSTDGVYTEILEGLEEGDLVQMAKALTEQPVNTTNLAITEKVVTNFARTAEMKHMEAEDLKNTLTGVEVYFQEYLVEKDTFVTEGTPMVRVRVEGDPYVVTELEMEIKRDKERLEDEIAARPEDMDEDRAEAFDESIAAKKEKIAEKEERLAELQIAYSTTTLNAPVDGYVSELQWFSGETLLAENQNLGTILCLGKMYLYVEDTYNMVQYGQNVTVDYGAWSMVETKVVNLGNYGLSAGLRNATYDYLGFYDDKTMLAFQEEYYQRYAQGRRQMIRVAAEIVLMQNVLTVPEAAVTNKDGATYVSVVQEDGSIVLKSFVGTRYNDRGDYWVIDGLTEGTTICWE